MLTIEDCIEELDNVFNNFFMLAMASTKEIESASDKDINFINQISSFTRNKKNISVNQGKLALKLISKYRVILEEKFTDTLSIDNLLQYPKYRIEPFISKNLSRTVRWIGNSKLIFRGRFGQEYVDEIKRLSSTTPVFSISNITYLEKPVRYIQKYTAWIVEVNERNIDKVIKFISNHNFQSDENVVEFLTNSMNSKNRKSFAELENNEIKVTVQNNELLQFWLLDLKSLEF